MKIAIELLCCFCRQSGGLSGANPMNTLVSLIQPHLGQDLVHEFGCTYKFIVIGDSGAFDIYHLDLKNGKHFILACIQNNVNLHCSDYENQKTSDTTIFHLVFCIISDLWCP